MADAQTRLARIDWAGRPVAIEYAWIGVGDPARANAPLVVFLHEGLGSLAMWKEFPEALCNALGVRGLVYSRPGYGRSTPRPPDERWDVDYMHRQAYEVLPALLRALKVDARRDPLWLLGHSDGASIALLYAARFPRHVTGVIVLAPHLFVEPVAVASITGAREAYGTTDLRERLARYHDDVDSAFRGWNDIWLAEPFRAWNIEDEVSRIECPVLAVQGREDEYGTLEQVRGMVRRLPGTRVVVLDECRHSPHRDQPETLINEVASFFASLASPAGAGEPGTSITP